MIRRVPGRGAPIGVKKRADKKLHGARGEVRRRTDELIASGMPYPMALAVAQGRLPLNEALERLHKRTEVERLMKEHDLTRALATQVVLGHADLEQFLAKRRFEEHRAANLERSCLDAALASGAILTFGLTDQRRVEARVVSTSTYQVQLQEEGKEPFEVHKLELKYAYAPEDWKKIKKGLTRDKALSEQPRRPAERPQDRYTCSDKRLFRYVDEQQPVEVVLLEGEVFHGTVTWFGRFEFGLKVKDAEVTVFRHALFRIAPK